MRPKLAGPELEEKLLYCRRNPPQKLGFSFIAKEE
jgi:hypothetical protein